MNFTYNAYKEMIYSLQKHGYEISFYHDWEKTTKCVILRHDIDNDIAKAVELAKVEYTVGAKSTYFVLVSSDFYNVFSAQNEKLLQEILKYGHRIGLHFDEKRYLDIKTPEDAISRILEEVKLLSTATGSCIDTVSMHRPSKMMLESDLRIPGMIDSYSQLYFKQFKYLSDSRRVWREPVDEIVAAETYKRLHILTHAFWYNEVEEDIHSTICSFVNAANMERYLFEKENITDLHKIMTESEVN